MSLCSGFYSEMDHNRAAVEPIKAKRQNVGAEQTHGVLREPILRPFEEVDRWIVGGMGGRKGRLMKKEGRRPARKSERIKKNNNNNNGKKKSVPRPYTAAVGFDRIVWPCSSNAIYLFA